jgi:CheY-like chemotaxis protein
MTAAGPVQTHASLDAISVLLVEDETMISFLVEDMLTELGCATVWHAGGVEKALALLRAHRPDAAILDVNLAGEPSFPIAERLEALQIPFVFATGYGRTGMPPRWAPRPTIQKPFRFSELKTALESLLAR